MSKIFNSLMLDTFNHKVDSVTEFNKAGLITNSLVGVLKDVPTLREMLRARLNQRLATLGLNIDAGSLYINRGAVNEEAASRPAGSLLEVVLECVTRGISPSYIQNIDAVYNRPDTNMRDYLVAGLSILKAEGLIEEERGNFAGRHVAGLDRHWNTPLSAIATRTRKDALQAVLAQCLMAELSLSVMAGQLDAYAAERTASILIDSNLSAQYRVSIDPLAEVASVNFCSFVVNISQLGLAELPLNEHSYGYVLYTPIIGFEYFDSSNQMHARLTQRLSLPGTSIGFTQLREPAFAHLTRARLKQQTVDLAKLFSQRAGTVDLLAAGEAVLQLKVIQDDWVSSLASLKAGIKRVEWPEWLRAAGADAQMKYVELETSMLKYETEFQRVHNGFFSLGNYVKQHVADWTDSALGVELDADNVRVLVRNELQVEQKTIRHEENLTLTDYVAIGRFDQGRAPRLTLAGHEGSGLTVAKLEQWLENVSLRKSFAETRPAVMPDAYREAIYNKLISMIEFDLWGARHSGQLDARSADQIQKGLAGDPRVLINDVTFVDSLFPLKDTWVFQDERGDVGSQLAYLKTPGGRFEFKQFSNLEALSKQIKAWIQEHPGYSASIMYPNEARAAEKRAQESRYLLKTSNAKRIAKEPFSSAAYWMYRFWYESVQQSAPLNYRNSPAWLSRTHARLSTELKALCTVETRTTGYPTYEFFARRLIKSRVEELLKTLGHSVQVNPDQIFIQITAGETITLTDLIIQEKSFEPPSSPRPDPSDYPRFYWSTAHPALDSLDIRYIASWSKTLRPGEKYIQHLVSEFKSGATDYQFKRGVFFKKLQNEMLLALLSEYFQGQLNAEQFSTLFNLISSFEAKVPPKLGDPVVMTDSLYQFMVKNVRRIDGVLFLRVVTSKGVEDFLYTPNAPDDRSFRSTEDFVSLVRLRNSGFREYFINRVPAIDRTVVNSYFDELQRYVNTISAPQPLPGNRIRDLRYNYDRHLNQIINDVDEGTTSLAEIIGRLVYDNVKLSAAIVSLVVPPVGIALTALELAESTYKGLQAYRYGDNQAALTHLKDALIGILTLSQASTAKATVTKAQKTLIEFFDDAEKVVGLVASVTGQTLGKERLLEIVQQVLDDRDAESSRTTIH
ncbi:hypothetical protein [Pseudomonas retamae]|uniref:Uncharacterized protein n=1 Tax=Pseudomonas retamae TaxID=702110 RepID=A0ABW7DE60_9PSED